MNTIHTHWQRILFLTFLWTLFFACCGALIAAAAWTHLPNEVFARNIWIENIDVSGISREAARQKILENHSADSAALFTLSLEDTHWSTPSATLGWQWNIEHALDTAYRQGRQGNWLQQQQERVQLAFTPTQIPLTASYDESLLRTYIATVAAEIDQPGSAASIQTSAQGYEIQPGERGQQVDQEQLFTAITQHPEQGNYAIPLRATHVPLTTDEVASAEARLARLWGKTLQLRLSETEPSISLPAREFFPWLNLPSGFSPDKLRPQLEQWQQETLREPINAEFVLGEGQRLEKFQPHQNGRALDEETLESQLFAAVLELESSTETEKVLQLPFVETEPSVTLEETNTLGIKERIGLGTSTYFHSIANRIYNVELTSNRIGAVLVAPGEEFSFAQTVGDISSASGYKSAYVIRNGRTELGDGGGVCQVSTTIFRAVLDAGLPITRWKNHSYRVSYYEQGNKPGFDATIYAPSVDFRFTNDTGHFLVVVPYNDPESLFLRVEIWGTNDGRESSIENYSLTNVRPAPAPLYQDDPSLPAGTRKQIDWAAPGATARFDYVVKKNGEVLFEKNFTSVYKPWQAVFLVGTGS